jgi:hypothetical protein
MASSQRTRDLRDLSPIPTDIRLYYAPLNGAPDVPSSHYNGANIWTVLPTFFGVTLASHFMSECWLADKFKAA